MKKLVYFLIALSVVAVACVQGRAGSGNSTPSDDTIIGLCGGRIAKVFAAFGTPEDVLPFRGDTEKDDGVILDYGSFSFMVREKVVCSCGFSANWKGSVKGIKIRDSQQLVEKVLVAPGEKTTHSDGTDILTWELKGEGLDIMVSFDASKRVDWVHVESK